MQISLVQSRVGKGAGQKWQLFPCGPISWVVFYIAASPEDSCVFFVMSVGTPHSSGEGKHELPDVLGLRTPEASIQ